MRSIRVKLIVVSLLIVFLPVYFLGRYATKSFDRFTRTVREDEMGTFAFMTGEQYKAMVLGVGEGAVGGKDKEFAFLLQRYSQKVDARMHVVSLQGIVLFDSDAEDSVVGRDFSARPEIQTALGGEYGANWKLTKNNAHVFYYIALPIQHEGETLGVAYVAGHTDRITKAILKMVKDQNLAMILALAGAFLMSVILAQTMTRRLRKLTRTSMAYAKGDSPLNPKIGGQDEISDLGHAIDRMATEIEQRNRYNRDFVTTVMHELKTPVTAIKGAAEVLQQGAAEKEETRNKFLSNICYQSDRLTRMIGELGELTKLDVENLRGQKQKVDYCQSVREILERLMPTFDQQHAAFSASIPDDIAMTMIVTGRIEQVISNLLENAFRYTPVSGSVELTVTSQDEQTILTSIKDTGSGIPAAGLKRVFDRFYTTEPKDVPRDYGSGLGLAIAKSIVENHQGKIWVESSPGNGSRFLFTLPALDE